MKIIIIEDDKGLNHLFRSQLESSGYSVESWFDGNSFLESAPELDGTLLLVDYLLPDMKANELIEKLTINNIPPSFVVITGYSDAMAAVQMMKSGALDYLVKDIHLLDILPTVVERVINKLETYLQLKEKETALQESEQKYRLLVENAHEAIFVFQGERFLFLNNKACEIVGYSQSELLELSPFDLIHKDDREIFRNRNMLRMMGEEVPGSFEICIVDKSGNLHWGFVNAVSIEWNEKPATLVFLHDTTKQKNMESKLRHSEQMDAIGRLAGGIAQDFSDILTSILGKSNLILFENDEESRNFSAASSIVRSAERLSALTQQLLGISKRGSSTYQELDFHRIIKQTVASFTPQLTKEQQIKLDLNSTIDHIEGDEVEIQQIIRLLLHSAQRFLGKSGEILVTTDFVFLDESFCRRRPGCRSGDYIRFTVEDQGCGIPDNEKHRLFDPYYNGPAKSGSSPLGYSHVYGIVRMHGGIVDVESAEGYGTVFRIYFPPAEFDRFSIMETVDPTYSGRILFVDDDPYLRQTAADILQQFGFEVITMIDGKSTLEYINNSNANIDLVLIDFHLPDVTGIEVFQKIREKQPKIKGILVSGFILEEEIHGIYNMGFSAILRKPLTIRNLTEMVHKVITEESPK